MSFQFEYNIKNDTVLIVLCAIVQIYVNLFYFLQFIYLSKIIYYSLFYNIFSVILYFQAEFRHI